MGLASSHCPSDLVSCFEPFPGILLSRVAAISIAGYVRKVAGAGCNFSSVYFLAFLSAVGRNNDSNNPSEFVCWGCVHFRRRIIIWLHLPTNRQYYGSLACSCGGMNCSCVDWKNEFCAIYAVEYTETGYLNRQAFMNRIEGVVLRDKTDDQIRHCQHH